MISFITIIKIIPLLVVIIFVYIAYKLKLWKLLPKESKNIMILLMIYIIINQLIDIAIEDIMLRLNMIIFITIIYIFLILVMFMRFYNKLRSGLSKIEVQDRSNE